jgi:hypothetical protein
MNEEEEELERKLEAFKRQFEAFHEAENRMAHALSKIPFERLTVGDFELLAGNGEENETLVRLIDDGHALRLYKGDGDGKSWTTPLHFICSFGRHRLLQRVLQKESANPDILRLPCDSDNDNAIETYLYCVVENLVSAYCEKPDDLRQSIRSEDVEEIVEEISKFVCTALQSGKITVHEVNAATYDYCHEEDDERFVHAVTRTWSTRLAALWCLQTVTKAHGLGDGLMEPMAHVLQCTWELPRDQQQVKKSNC